MMKAAARIKVRETHGIRRFLYPLSAEISLPAEVSDQELGLFRADGRPIPLQMTPADDQDAGFYRLDFAVSLAPLEHLELTLRVAHSEAVIQDPLRVAPGESLRSEQQRFTIAVDRSGAICEVVYDKVPHLRAPHQLTRNGASAEPAGAEVFGAGLPLAARILASSRYPDGCRAQTRAEITACKSWLTLTHTLEAAHPGDVVEFLLPLAVTAPVLTCDFGCGGGTYGKVQAGTAPEIVWQTDFTSSEWSLSGAGRIDYRGTIGNRFHEQHWFHLVDRDKAVAVAILEVPKSCEKLTVILRASGEIFISFQLGSVIKNPVSFCICYHFLNDIPPLSAATNPQSILLPPLVEVV
jgi:hypothetical protein